MTAALTRTDRPATDRRSQRTRAAILDAFAQILLSQGYEAITPTGLAAAANVGRSTFYEHFANVDEVLAFSVARILAPVATSITQAEPPPGLTDIIQHFWDNRRMARALLAGGGHPVIQRLFTEQIEAGLAELRARLGVTAPRVSPKLAATHLAAGALALIGAWLSGQASGSADEIAGTLHAGGYAAARAMSCRAAEAQA